MGLPQIDDDHYPDLANSQRPYRCTDTLYFGLCV